MSNLDLIDELAGIRDRVSCLFMACQAIGDRKIEAALSTLAYDVENHLQEVIDDLVEKHEAGEGRD